LSEAVAAARAQGRRSLRAPATAAGALIVLGLLTIGDILLGPAGVEPGHALRLLLSPDGSTDSALVQSLRLPRAISGLAVGVALGVAGALLQAAVRNPLAEPGTLGINAGAALGVTLAAVLGISAGALTSVPFALAGGAIAAAIVLGLGRGSDDPVRMILAGVAVAFAFMGVASALQIIYAQGYVSGGLQIWGNGTIEQPGWAPVRAIAPVVPLLALAALSMTRDLDALMLGDEHAEALGVDARRARLIAIGVAVVLSCIAVALAGPIGFVGLAAPHIARRLGALRGRALLLASAAGGAALVLAADIVALAINGEKVKTGVICAVAGAPLLVVIARRVYVHAPAGALRDSARSAHRAVRRTPSRRAGTALAVGVLLIAFVASLGVGDLWLGPADVVGGLFGHGQWALVVQDLRLPRAAVAALAGMALAVSGVLSQGVVRNPLAGPEVLGVMGGATLAALGALVLVRPGQGGVALAAFAGGFAALVVVYAASPRDLNPLRLALIGVAVATACAALADMLLLFAGPAATQGLVLLSGSTYAQGWGDFAVLAPMVAAAGGVAWLAARRLDALSAGDDMAISLGVPAARTRALLLAASAVLAAGAVAIVGAIVFVGLMAPHAARMLVGPQHRRVLPVAAVLGAAFLLVADLLGRSVLAGSYELPSGLVTAIVGGLLLLLLLRRA
jgi:ABC-type Fe3+-siderophore transport system permease subunit